MNKLSNSLVLFAGKETSAYEKFRDYYFHYSDEVLKKNIGSYDRTRTFAEKEAKIDDVFLSEIERVAGVKCPSDMKPEIWASNPQIKWSTFAVTTMMIETILPATVIDTIGLYTDMRFIDFGDVANFDIPNRALFTVSQGANAQRTTMIQKQYKSNQMVPVYNHVITTQVDMYKVLARRDSLAEYARKAVISIETAMSREAYGAVVAGLKGTTVPAALKVSGAFSMEKLVKLAQTVGAYNYGMKPIIAGTTLGLMKVLPDSASGYRINTDANNMNLQLIRTAYEYDFMVLPQVATGDYSNFGLALDDNFLMVISPAADKLVRGVIEGSTLTNSNQFYDNADLTQNFTINKRYGFEFLSGAIAGSYEITG